jgi:hypothetical protein
VGTQLLKNTYNDLEIQNKLGEICYWMEATGSAFFKDIWDPAQGEVIAQIDTGQGVEEIREGDLDALVCPAQEILPDSCYKQDVKQCRSIIHAKTYDVDEIEEIFGVRVDPEETTAMQLQKSMMGIGGLGYGQGGFYFITSRLKNHAIVKEYWERPSKKFPKGRLIIVCSNKRLYYGDLPYPVGKDYKLDLPFRKVDCITRGGVFFGKTVIERLIPVQRRYNALKNRKAEYLNRAAIGQWTVMKDSVDLDVFELDSGSPGAIHEYERGASKPEPVQYPALPSTFETEENSLLQEFNRLSGVSELSKLSTAPAGVKSGVALSIALDQDDTRLSSTAGNIAQFLVENGKVWLRMCKKFVQGVRTLRSIGRNNVVELMDWTAADIRSDDVVIEEVSALVESPAQRRAMVFDLLESGLFLDPDTGHVSKETRAKILEIIEMGNWETADDDDELHISKAERENRKMQDGIAAVPVDYDDHVLHINRHNKFRLTTDYEELLAQNPLIDQMFQAHIEMHMLYMAQPAQQAAMAQTMLQQNPGGGESAA